MLKTSAKILLIFVLMVVVAVATGFVTYTLTKRIADENAVSSVEAATATETAKSLEPIRKNVTKPESLIESEDKMNEDSSECYTVRLEGTTLGVYVINDGKEEFLYHADVYKNDLSVEDLNLLQQGVNLKSRSELTGFIENFTS